MTDVRQENLTSGGGGAPGENKRCVVIWYASQLSHMIGPLAQELYERLGIQTVIACLDKAAIVRPADLGIAGPAIAGYFEVKDLLKPRPLESIDAIGFAADAEAFESRLGLSLREVVRSDRHLGINYLTATVFPRSGHAVHLVDLQVMDIALRLSSACELMLREWQPMLVFCYPGMLASMALSEVAQRLGIPLRGLAKGRKKREQFHWLVNKYATWWGLEEAFNARLESTAVPVDGGDRFNMGTPFRMQEALNTLRSDASLKGLLRQLNSITRRTILDRLRYRGRYGGYRYLDNLFYVFRMWLWRRRVVMERIDEDAVMGILSDGRPFIFYPLQTEPESNLMAEAPMCDNQLTIIDWLCKAAPAGWYVAVKEHPAALSPKPFGFWKRLRKYPNLVVLPTLASGEAIATRSRVVAVINGTLGLQATIAGLPVLCFHPHYQGLVAPHVLFAESYQETATALNRIRDGEIPNRDERQRTGQAYNDALDDCSFDLTDDALILGRPGPRAIPEVDAEVLAATLMQSLEEPARYDGKMRTNGGDAVDDEAVG